jgi:hypothetical protein
VEDFQLGQNHRLTLTARRLPSRTRDGYWTDLSRMRREFGEGSDQGS